MRLLAAIALLSALGCKDKDPYDEYPRTPAGYRLKIDDYGSGLDYGQAAARFDAAMIDAAVMMHDQYGVDVGYFLAVPSKKEIVFHFVDHVYFFVEGTRARGMVDGHRILVVYWAHSTIYGLPIATPQDAPPGTPPWTILPSEVLYPGQYSYGMKHDRDVAALLKHEIGHVIFGFDFEH